MVINALSFVVLRRLADEPEVSAGTVMLSACVGALAYLNKLSYVYIPLALAAAGIASGAFRRESLARTSRLSLLFSATFLIVVVAVGFLIIGEQGFHALLRFHNGIIFHTGQYGQGEAGVVDTG